MKPLVATLGLALVLVSGQASAQLSATPITWDVVGLDSNRPLTSGPELFPVGAEICSAVATTNVTVDFVWPDGNGNGWDFGTGHPFINLRPGSLTSLSFPSIGAGECVDAYFELRLTRSAAAFDQSREYVIQASDGVESASSPSPRAIHVEYLVSQNRNTTQQIRYGQQADQSDWVILGAGGNINLAVDETYFIELTTATATAYEELQSFVTLSNTIFQVISVSTTYTTLTAPPSRVPVPNPRLWADGCLWESDLNSPNYLSCLADGKAGGTVVTVYEIHIISTGGDSVGLEALIYDRSGGSFHYNTDYSESPGDLNTFDPTDSDLSKRFVPATIGIGGTSRLRFTISNPNPIDVSGYNFIDNLPLGVEVASPPNASTTCGGIWNPLATDTVLAFDGGAISANGSCTILVDVTAAATGTYDNTSNNLFIGATDTGSNASASLVVSATQPPVLQCNDLATLAQWQFPTGASATAPAPTSSLVTATAAAGSGLTPTIETDTIDAGTGSWSSDFINTGALVLANNQFFEFVVDTTGLDSIAFDFGAKRTSQGPQNLRLYYGPVTGTEVASTTYTVTTAFQTYTPTTLTTNLNPTGTTRFRLYAYAAAQNNNGHAVFIDSVRFRGLSCQPVPPPPPVPGVAPPQISKSFSPDPIGVGQQTTLTFVVSNPNPATSLSGIAVSDQLPAGVSAVAGSFGGTCSGFWGLDPSDSGVVLYSGGSLVGGASCTLTVDVTASAVGTSLNISDVIYSTESGYSTNLTTGVAQAGLDVLAPPIIAKDFDPNLILLGVTPGDAAALTFTVTNPNPGNAIAGVSFSDTFPAGLIVATPPNATTSGCGSPTWSPVAGDGAVAFSAGSIAAAGTCTVVVDVTGPAGVFPNTSSPASHVVAGVTATNGDTASNTVVIDNPIPGVALLKQVGLTNDPDDAWAQYLAVATGTGVYYKLTVENVGELPLTGITVSDPTVNVSGCIWPDPLPVADISDPLAHIAVCIVGPVAAVAGTHMNTASLVTDQVPGPTSDSATYATVGLDLAKVASPLTFTAAGEVISYTFTVTNTGSAILPGPVTISDPLVPGAICPSLTTIGNGDVFFDPLEAVVCTGSYTIQAADLTTGSVTNTATATVAGFDSPPDSETVTSVVPEPTIGKVFGTDPVAVGGTSVLTITVTNNAAIGLTGVGFSDTLPAGLSFAAAVTSSTCGGSATVNGTFDTLTLTGGAIAASSSCTVTITVNADAAGSYTNTTSVVSSNEATGTTTGSDTLGVTITEPTIAKAFTDTLIGTGETTTLTLTVTNTAAAALSSVAFTDTLPAGLVYAGAPTSNTCGGTATVNGTFDTLTLAGGAIAASDSCVITVDVTGVTAGNYTNTTSVVTSTEVNGTTTASDDLQVEDLPTISKVFTDDTIAPTDTTTLTITVTNNATIALTNVSFTDSLPVTAAGELSFAAPVAGTCSLLAGFGSTITTTTGTDDTLTVSGFGLAAGASCTVTVDVTGNAEGAYTNTTSVVSSTELTGTGTGTDDLSVGDLPTIAKGFAPDPINAGTTSTLTLTVTNNAGFALTGVSFDDVLPAGLLYSGAPLTDTCSGTTTINPGNDTLTVTGGTIAADSSCTITTAVLGVAGGTHTNTTSVVDSTELTGTTTGSDTLTVNVPEPTIGKVFGTDPVAVGGTSVLTITVTNNAAIGLTGVGFSDTLPAGVSFAAAASGNTCGGTATVNGTFDTLTLTGGAIAASGSCTVTITVNADAAGSYTNTTSVVSSNEATGTTTGSDTLAVTVPDLSIVKSDGGITANAGDTVVYTLSYANNGTGGATGVALTETVPADSTFNPGASTAGWVCAPNNNAGSTCILTVGNLSSGGNGSATFAVDVDDPLAVGVTQISNTATIADDGANGVDPTPGDNTSTDTTPVDAAPILAAAKADVLLIDSDGDGVADPGDTIRYTITITNSGNTAATNVMFADTPDSNTALVVGSVTATLGSVTTGNTGGDTTVSVDVGTVAVSATVTITFDVLVDSPFPVGATTVANQGTLTADGPISVPTDDPDTPTPDDPTLTPVEDPSLEVTKADALFNDADGNSFPSPGDTLEYTVVITNTGNVPVGGVVFTDTPDPNTSLDDSGTVTTTLGTVTSGNTAGDTSVSVDVGTIAVSGVVTITFRVIIDDPLPIGVTSVSNQGLITSDDTPDQPTDDPDDPTPDDPTDTPVTAEPVLTASKVDVLTVDGNGNGIAEPGDTLSYTVAITNSGNTAATAVLFDDSPDPNTSLVVGSATTTQGTVTIGNTGGDTSVSVDIGDIAAAVTVTITFDVTINDPLPGGTTQVSNQGLATSTNHGDVPTDDPDDPTVDDPTDTPVVATPDLSATKVDTLLVDADGSGSVTPGDTLSYTITIWNTGTTEATGVTFDDPIPVNTTVEVGSVMTSQGAVASEDPVQVTIGAIAPAASVTISFHVVIDNPLPGGVTTISNQGTVTSNEVPDVPTDDPDDPTPDDPTDTPVGQPQLAAAKADALVIDADMSGAASPGDTLQYTIVISNTGSAPTTGILLSDAPDPLTTLVVGSVTTTQGVVTSGNGGGDSIVTVDLGTLAAGASATVTFRVLIGPLPAGMTTLSNQGTVTSNEVPDVPTDDPDDPTPDDPTDTPAVAGPVLDVFKAWALTVDADTNGSPSPGDTLTYSLTVINSGNAAATGVILNDVPDANTTLVAGSVTTSQGAITSGNAGAPPVTIDLGTVGAGVTVTITYQVTINDPIPAGVTDLVNQAQVTSNELPPVSSDDPTTGTVDDPTDVPLTQPEPLVSATKSVVALTDLDGDGFAGAGDQLGYTVTITNLGNVPIAAAAFFDMPDPATTLIAGTVTSTQGAIVTGNTAGDLNVEVTIGDIAIADVVVITFDVRINTPLPSGVNRVANQGLVTSDSVPDTPTDDPSTPTADDPTTTDVTAGGTAIPDLGALGRLMLVLLLAAAGALVLRQRMV